MIELIRSQVLEKWKQIPSTGIPSSVEIKLKQTYLENEVSLRFESFKTDEFIFIITLIFKRSHPERKAEQEIAMGTYLEMKGIIEDQSWREIVGKRLTTLNESLDDI